jgi:hypothetical protein
MCAEKHDMHFLAGVELVPHVFVNIPDERIHITVFYFIFITHFIFIILNFIHIFIHSFLLVGI